MIFEWIKDMFLSSVQDPAGVIKKPEDVIIDDCDFSYLNGDPKSVTHEDLLKMNKLQLETFGREFLNIELDRRKSHRALVTILWERLKTT